jgi:hypothetical protein
LLSNGSKNSYNVGMSSAFIYTLSDENGVVRYVGKSVNPQRRFIGGHLVFARTGESKDHKCNWIRSMLARGLKPELRIIEECGGDDWKERERYWIKFYRDAGCDLTNALPGGGGGPSGIKWTAEQREKKRLAYENMTPEARAAWSAKLKAAASRKHSAEHNAKVRAACNTPEYKQQASKRHTGNQYLKGRTHTPERKAQIAASMRAARARKSWSTKPVLT